MPLVEDAIVWRGNPGLERLLVPLVELRTHPRNPRRGDVRAIVASLDRFGQQRPILALEDGTIVAGNHTFRALVEAGWTHAAVVRSALQAQEVEAYLVADNRTGDLAFYDDVALAEILQPFLESNDLAGLGWSDEDARALLIEFAGWSSPLAEEAPRLDQLGTQIEGGRAFTLVYSAEEADEFEELVAAATAVLETRNLPATVLEALRRVRPDVEADLMTP